MILNKRKLTSEVLIVSQLRPKFSRLKNSHILFLNDGCKLYKNENVHKVHKNNRVLNFRTNLSEKKFFYLIKIYEILLKEISLKLNKIHNVDCSLEYWRILIGPWLFQFISIIFWNYKTLQYINNNLLIKYVEIANINDQIYPFKDANDFSYSATTDEFNNKIYNDLLKYFKNIKVKYFEVTPKKNKFKKNISNLKLVFLNFISNYLNLNFQKKVFIHEPYFPATISFLLQIRLWQFPSFYKSPLIANKTLNKSIRIQKFSRSKNVFLNILKDLVFKYMPGSYIENFGEYKKKFKKINWPKNPRIVFSSNSFFHDDFFKLWLAEEKENYDPKFISGQHGGSFFISKFHFYELHQKKISDQIATWGYKKEDIYKPLFNFKACNKNIKFNPKGSFLMIDFELSRFPTASIVYNNFLFSSHLNNKIIFLKNLSSRIQSKLVFRPYSHDLGWNTLDKVKKIYGSIKVDQNKNIYDSLKNSRICISTVNSTTFLETLNLNFPTIIYFDLKKDLIRNDAKSCFDHLKEVNIYFDNPISAAEHLNNIWDQIDKWWFNKRTQKAVSYFCNKYSKRTNNPINELVTFFQNN